MAPTLPRRHDVGRARARETEATKERRDRIPAPSSLIVTIYDARPGCRGRSATGDMHLLNPAWVMSCLVRPILIHSSCLPQKSFVYATMIAFPNTTQPLGPCTQASHAPVRTLIHTHGHIMTSPIQNGLLPSNASMPIFHPTAGGQTPDSRTLGARQSHQVW